MRGYIRLNLAKALAVSGILAACSANVDDASYTVSVVPESSAPGIHPSVWIPFEQDAGDSESTPVAEEDPGSPPGPSPTDTAPSVTQGPQTAVSGGEPEANVGSATGALFPSGAAVAGAWMPPGFAAWQWASGLQDPRGMVVDPTGTVLVVESSRVLALWDAQADGVASVAERGALVEGAGLSGITLAGAYLYASNATTVFRWPYTSSQPPRVGDATEVVTGLPGVADSALYVSGDFLYVSIGGGGAGGAAEASALVSPRRFTLSELEGSVSFEAGQLVGERPATTLASDALGNVWGIDPFASAPDEPGETTVEELYLVSGDASPKQRVVFPRGAQASSVMFYGGGNFPSDYRGDALVTLHGAWNDINPIGHKVVRVKLDTDGQPTGSWDSLYENACDGDATSRWADRPVSLGVLPNGTVLVSSDQDGDRIIGLGYIGDTQPVVGYL